MQTSDISTYEAWGHWHMCPPAMTCLDGHHQTFCRLSPHPKAAYLLLDSFRPASAASNGLRPSSTPMLRLPAPCSALSGVGAFQQAGAGHPLQLEEPPEGTQRRGESNIPH